MANNTYFTDRIAEHPGRVKLTNTSNSAQQTYDVERAEGAVTEEGTRINAAAMNQILNQVIADTIGGEPVTYDADSDEDNIESGMTIEETFARLQTILSKLLGVKIEAGLTEEQSVSASSYLNFPITFTEDFTAMPILVATARNSTDTAGISACVLTGNSSSATIRVRNNNTSARTVKVEWIAIEIS